MADLCEKVGANVQEVARGIGLDGRIGRKFLHPGPGYGGSCFPKDTLALVRTGAATPARRSRSSRRWSRSTRRRKQRMAEQIVDACGGNVAGKTVAVLGLTFKPNTDDMRESPSLDIVPRLLGPARRCAPSIPRAWRRRKKLMPGVVFCDEPYQAMEDADALVIITEWNEFRALDLERVKACAAADGRPAQHLQPAEMAAAGFDYPGIGRPCR